MSGAFVLDDAINIANNPALHLSSLSIEEIKKIFSPYQASPTRIVANFTFALNYYFGGLNLVGFHFVNIVIHFINCILVFTLFQWYFRKSNIETSYNLVIISCLAALIWATNPIQTNAVTYVVQRMTSLSTLFCLASLHCYLKARSDNISKLIDLSYKLKNAGLYLLSSFFWILALRSKEIAAVLPLILIVHEFYFFESFSKISPRKKLLIFLPFLLLILSLILFYLSPDFINKIIQGYNKRDFTLTERLLTQPRVVFHYLSLFFYPLPTRLNIYYDDYIVSKALFNPPTTALAILGTLSLFLLIFIAFKKNKLMSFGILWLFVCLCLESSVIALELVFDHRFYLPSIGLTLALTALAIPLFVLLKKGAILCYFFMAIIIITQMMGTYTRNQDWQNEVIFSIDAVEKKPDSTRALVNLGAALIRQREPKLATIPLQKALALEPGNIDALNDMFSIMINPPYLNEDSAENFLQQIFTVIKKEKYHPNWNEALYNLSHYLYQQERYSDSLLLLNKIKESYTSPDVLSNLGSCLIQLGDYSTALSYLEKALVLDKDNGTISHDLAYCYLKLGQYDKAEFIINNMKKNPRIDIKLTSQIQALFSQMIEKHSMNQE